MLTLLALLAVTQPPAKSAAAPEGYQKAEDPYPPADPTVKLPQPEQLRKAGLRSFSVRQTGGGFALYCGSDPVREFGGDRRGADDTQRAVQWLQALTDWGTVAGRPPLDYAVANGRAAPVASDVSIPGARPIDLKSVRAEGVRGAWLVRDDYGLLVNFGPDAAAAEQAAAVCKRYGFNRLVAVGGPDQPAARLLVAAPVDLRKQPPADPSAAFVLNQNLTRTGVPVPGGGYAGEQITLDPHKVEVRRERADWVLAHGREVLARFGGDDNAAREAARFVTDARLTEFCTVGGLTFFLSHGQPPTRVPFTARSLPVHADQLQAVPLDGKWAVAAGGRVLFPAASEAEAKQMIGVVQAYKFDTFCQFGASSRGGLKFLARTGGGR